MAQRCDVCGKGPMYGHARSHAMNASNRRFMPNLSKRKIVYQGKKQKLKVCTNCLRTMNKQNA